MQSITFPESFNQHCEKMFVQLPYPGLPEPQELKLSFTGLNRDDLQHLTHLIQTRKLPEFQLRLVVIHTGLDQMFNILLNLAKTVTYKVQVL